MKSYDFNFLINTNLLAERPAKERDEARLMIVYKKTGNIEHKLFKDIIHYFNENDVIILNNTKVIPSLLYGKKEKTESNVEVILLREISKEEKTINVLVNKAKKLRIGNKILFDKNLIAEVIDNTSYKGRTLKFLSKLSYYEFKKHLESICEPYLPKYIKRNERKRYQTTYAKEPGSVIAPYSGFHFSKILIKNLHFKNIFLPEITLHLGIKNYSTIIKVEDFSKHKIYSEPCYINQSTCDIVNKAIKEKRRICAVGTSTMQAIESSVSAKNELLVFNGWTQKFIFPPYQFRIANSMITNFHIPKSPFFMTLVALLGSDSILHIYQTAIKEEYKFSFYGDSLLIL